MDKTDKLQTTIKDKTIYLWAKGGYIHYIVGDAHETLADLEVIRPLMRRLCPFYEELDKDNFQWVVDMIRREENI